MWRYTSIADLINILRASTLGSLTTISAFTILPDFAVFPKSVLLIDYILCTLFLCASRASVRLYYSSVSNNLTKMNFTKMGPSRKKIIIIGAGSSSEK